MMYHNQSCEVIVIGYHRNLVKDAIRGYSPVDSMAAKFLQTKNGWMAMDIQYLHRALFWKLSNPYRLLID